MGGNGDTDYSPGLLILNWGAGKNDFETLHFFWERVYYILCSL